MSQTATLPFVFVLSESVRAGDRAVFVRIYHDFARHCRELAQPIPDDWRRRIATCLLNAGSGERGEYLLALAGIDRDEGSGADRLDPLSALCGRNASEQNTSNASLSGADPTPARHEDGEAVLQGGNIEEIMAVVLDQSVRLDARQIATLVNRARGTLDADDDPRLAEAILARRPARIEMAPLFLEANSDQRWAIVLAAQRAELGRRRNGAIAIVAREIIGRLEYAAIADNASDFSDLLGRTIGASPGLAKRIAQDPTGEPLAIALIAIRAPNDVCVRILTARDMHERGKFRRILALTRLGKSMSPLAARRIVSALIGASAVATKDARPPIPAQRQYNQRADRSDAISFKPKLAQPRNASTVGAK